MFLCMQRDGQTMIEAIQSSGYQSVWVVTGGGSGAAHHMLAHAGASRFMLEVQIPYSSEAIRDYLGSPPDGFCCAETARLLAVRAYERAVQFAGSNEVERSLLGVACTAALQTSRKRRGQDRAYFCIRSGEQEMLQKIDLSAGSREDQEAELSSALLRFVAAFLGLDS